MYDNKTSNQYDLAVVIVLILSVKELIGAYVYDQMFSFIKNISLTTLIKKEERPCMFNVNIFNNNWHIFTVGPRCKKCEYVVYVYGPYGPLFRLIRLRVFFSDDHLSGY